MSILASLFGRGMFFSTAMVKHLVALGRKKLCASLQSTALRMGVALFSAAEVRLTQNTLQNFLLVCVTKFCLVVEGHRPIYLGEGSDRTENE